MKPTTFLTDDELLRKGVEALMDRLGPIEAVRFLGVKRELRIDAVSRHRRWQRGLDKEQFLREVFGPRF